MEMFSLKKYAISQRVRVFKTPAYMEQLLVSSK